ncbi:MAG: hypothetical protein COW01_15040 [Bdellovibrionales bacterium CG12_big_fil_rev_8_21_14_0_65_38_15]|nr:MAG: hypothetical protein COW79_09700 [Bdellovibrionales bacterium CG22_combo_CG10-13_8_21_14_all_38_13]PIQ52752.1 MAG: hypothetical protein COW01_15040 [Bdellovibrionales bacterium CG12_big_fil_rev_8_21_14_0_65_38_15]PIR31441.1 MAG: hypothetical protein COV38_00550 [Bdellovibrionales bacterium CG11_big_fil_rev_8_21_14_0_20_38_13]
MADNNDEQIFNEDELQDIMNEFESLEQEYNDAPEQAKEVKSVAPTKVEEEVQQVEDEGELNIVDEIVDDFNDEVEEETHDNVVSMSAKTSAPKSAPAATHTHHNASSNVSMSMEFPIGDQVAQIGLNPEYGFSFNMDGVELTIDAENGCVMTLPGGMTFTFPAQHNSKQKKSA